MATSLPPDEIPQVDEEIVMLVFLASPGSILFPHQIMAVPYGPISEVVYLTRRHLMKYEHGSRSNFPRYIAVAPHVLVQEALSSNERTILGCIGEIMPQGANDTVYAPKYVGRWRFKLSLDQLICHDIYQSNIPAYGTVRRIEDQVGPFQLPRQLRTSLGCQGKRRRRAPKTAQGDSLLHWTWSEYEQFDCVSVVARMLQSPRWLLEAQEKMSEDPVYAVVTSFDKWNDAFLQLSEEEQAEYLTRFSFEVARLFPLAESQEDLVNLLRENSVLERLKMEHKLLAAFDDLLFLICKTCHEPFSDSKALFAYDSQGITATFVNPNCFMHKLCTINHIEQVTLDESPPTTEDSWFPGYAWQIVYCATCNRHLGWEFTKKNPLPSQPERFWAVTLSQSRICADPTALDPNTHLTACLDQARARPSWGPRDSLSLSEDESQIDSDSTSSGYEDTQDVD